MRRSLLMLLCGGFAASASAQSAVSDTVSLGAQYVDQVWYQLSSGQETRVADNSWDIAFKSAGVQSAAVFANDDAGTQVWEYPGSISDWATLDTAGMTGSWPRAYNSDENWEVGAFNALAGSGQFDYGWGEYSSVNHVVTGTTIFVLQLSDGSFKKLLIDNLTQGVYTFKYADIDGANEVTATVDKNQYSQKNFVYYKLTTDQIVDIEPNSADWDFFATQYTAMIPMGADTVPYVVSGIFTNIGVGVIKAEGVDADSYEAYEADAFTELKNAIGHLWKSYDMASGEYVVADSTVFFVQDLAGDIWKVVFTAFGGSATGDMVFSKKKLTTTAVVEGKQTIASVAVFPNPVRNGDVSLTYSLATPTEEVRVTAFDATGKQVYARVASGRQGMHLVKVATADWNPGVYWLRLQVSGQVSTHQVVVY